VSFRHRSNPVFDETLELLLDGSLTRQPDLAIHVEVWVQHFILPSTFKGRVSIPLRQVLERRRLRDTWPLEGVRQGRITLELSWFSVLAM
jgi:hypothetical protein